MAELIDAVSTCLMARGLAPVNAIVSGHPLHASATRILERKKEGFCSHRWWFNTETEVQLSPDPDTHLIALDATVLDVDDCDYIIMNGYLYDPVEGTNIFEDNPDTVTLIYNRDWADLPGVAFNHVEAMGKEEFIRPLNDQLKTQMAVADVKDTYARFQITDLRHKDVNTSANPLFQKWQQKMIVR